MRLGTRHIASVIVFAVVSWGLLSAQQRDGNLNVPHIGYLGFRPLTESVSIEIVAALNEGLRNLGHAEGRDYILDLRSADDDADRFPALVAELTRLQVKLIFAPSTPAAVAIHKANPAMPIVVRGPDIVGAGLAQSASRPGGMVTGIDEVGTGDTAKRLRLLKQAVPAISRVAILGSAPSEAGHVRAIAEAEEAAKAIAVTLTVFRVSATTDLDPIFAGLRSDRVDAILCSGGILPRPVEQRIVELAARHRLPAMYPAIDYVQLGGLLSYGYRTTEMIRAAATYVDRLLKGANAGDLPLTIWDRYYLTVNAKAAAALDLALPTTLLSQADEVIK
jgi:putative tryptophan/tyrosine transport system substrate-binding protein